MASQHGFPNHTFWGSIVWQCPEWLVQHRKFVIREWHWNSFFVSWPEHKSGSGDRRKCTIRSMAQINHLQHFTTIPPFPNPMKYCTVWRDPIFQNQSTVVFSSWFIQHVAATRSHRTSAESRVPGFLIAYAVSRNGLRSFDLQDRTGGEVWRDILRTDGTTQWDNNGTMMR